MGKQIVALFAGQGAQKVGMGKDLGAEFALAGDLITGADQALGYNLSEIMFEGPIEALTDTSNCQPALYVHGLACLAALTSKVPDLEIKATAGLSLGEFTAHAAAGTFDFQTGLDLVHKRGSFMQEACEDTNGTMAAMIGGNEEDVIALAADCDVDVANFNAPGQIVLSGSEEGIAKAVAEAKGRGIRMAKALTVAGAYHSRLMATAQEKLHSELAQATITPPRVPVWSNFLARPAAGPDEIRSSLESQVTGSVRWSESILKLIEEGNTTFIEFGPGKVLAGLMNRIAKGTNILSVEDVPSLEAAIETLNS